MNKMRDWWLSLIARSLMLTTLALLTVVSLGIYTFAGWVGTAIFATLGILIAAIQPRDKKPISILRTLAETPDPNGAPRLSDSEPEYSYNNGKPPLRPSSASSVDDTPPSPPTLMGAMGGE